MPEPVIRVRPMIQWCPTCRRLAEATLVLGFTGGYHTSDRSTCDECKRVLWDWKRIEEKREPLVFATLAITKPKQGRLF